MNPRLCLLFALGITMIAATGCTQAAPEPATGGATDPAGAAVATADTSPAPVDTAIPAGRFGCTRSVYDSSSGTFEFQPRGFVEFDDGGGYAYRGFENPSEGRVVAEGAVRRFEGGHLDGGEFVPVEDRPGQFTLTAPGIVERWSCKDTQAE